MDNPMLSEIMSKYPVTVDPKDTVVKVENLFKENGFHHLPVVDSRGEVVGIVSRSDYLLLCDRQTLFVREKECAKNRQFFQAILVEEIMSKSVAKLKSDATASTAVGLFRENLFHAIPIVNDEDQLVGIVTPLDLINYAYS